MKIWTMSAGVVLAIAVILGGLSPIAQAEASAGGAVTFTKDVLPILQEHCQTCHRAGGSNIAGMVAPMSLSTYAEARPWAKSIARNAQTRKMPPWFATEATHGVFSNERRLSEDEIGVLMKWAASGAKRGRPQDAPKPLKFESNNGWFAGEPDLVVTLPEPYFVPDELDDQYVNFMTEAISEEQLPYDRWLRSIEWRGDSEVVHHIVGSAILTGPDGEEQRFELGSIAPGEEPSMFPPGYGKLLRKGSKIRFNMHYHKEAGPGTGTWDQSMVGFRFWDEKTDPPVRYPVLRNGISNHGFEIPPGHGNWQVGAAQTFEEDTTILSLHPHMHLRGKDAKYIAVYPDGTRESILDIPAYDFNWQLDYSFKVPKRVPAGTRVEFTAHFDNSTDNPYNPDPTIPMVWGGPTTMEMMIGYISYCATDPVVDAKARALARDGDTD